jgi:hypothetical protein
MVIGQLLPTPLLVLLFKNAMFCYGWIWNAVSPTPVIVAIPLKIWMRVHLWYIPIVLTFGGIPTTFPDYSALCSVQKHQFLLWLDLRCCLSTTNYGHHAIESSGKCASIVYPECINLWWHPPNNVSLLCLIFCSKPQSLPWSATQILYLNSRDHGHLIQSWVECRHILYLDCINSWWQSKNSFLPLCLFFCSRMQLFGVAEDQMLYLHDQWRGPPGSKFG